MEINLKAIENETEDIVDSINNDLINSSIEVSRLSDIMTNVGKLHGFIDILKSEIKSLKRQNLVNNED